MSSIAEMNQAYTTRIEEQEIEIIRLKEALRRIKIVAEANTGLAEANRIISKELDDFKQLTIDCCPVLKEESTGTHDELLKYINSLENDNKTFRSRLKEMFECYDDLRKEVAKMDPPAFNEM